MKNNLARLLFVAALAAQTALAAPGLISHQGRVTVNGLAFNGTGQFKFALVDADGTTTYWSNDGTSTGGSAPTDPVSLSVSRGIFAVNLGDTNLAHMTTLPAALFANNPAIYLRTWFDDGTTGFQQISPTVRLTSAGYALSAETSADFAASAASGIAASDTNAWNAKVAPTRTLSTTAPLTGGGDLSADRTLGLNASSANTPSYVVQRDASGNFSAGTITASLNGTATTATTAANVSGTVAVANGGTGAGTASGGLNNLLPTQSGNTGKVLATDGASASWSTPAGMTWNNVTGTSQAAAVNNGYLANNAFLVTVTLPTSPALGDIIAVTGAGAGGWKIAQTSGQSVLGLNSFTGLPGGTWTARATGLGNLNWYGVASSSDGTKLVAAAWGNNLYTSTDSGTNWTARDSSHLWQCVASSADGTKLVAGVGGGNLYTSVPNAGFTTTGTSGALQGPQYSALELQCISASPAQFIPRVSTGVISYY
ncbi:MAG: hypothetical protein WCL11_21015 [Verrucomicrobiota bacterium]